MDEKRLKKIEDLSIEWGSPVELDEVFAEVRRLRGELTKARAGCPEHGWPSSDHEAQLRRAERERCAKAIEAWCERGAVAGQNVTPEMFARVAGVMLRALPESDLPVVPGSIQDDLKDAGLVEISPGTWRKPDSE